MRFLEFSASCGRAMLAQSAMVAYPLRPKRDHAVPRAMIGSWQVVLTRGERNMSDWTSSPGHSPTLQETGDVNDGRPVGLVRQWGFRTLHGIDASMVWHPEDQYATRPSHILKVDEAGRHYMEGETDAPGGMWPALMIDTRIPLEARIPMAEGRVPVLSYQEWMEGAG